MVNNVEFGKKETFRMEGRKWIERWYLKGKLEFEKGWQGLKKKVGFDKERYDLERNVL